MEGAIRLTSEIWKKLATFVEMYETNVNEYNAKFSALNENLNQEIYSNDELSRQIEVLLRDKKMLMEELEETNALVVTSVRTEIQQEQLSKETWNREKRDLMTSIDSLRKENESLQESLSSLSASLRNEHEHKLNKERETNSRLREMIDGASKERDEAYHACKVLQKEIDMLRRSLDESKERGGELRHSDCSVSSSGDREKLAELIGVNDSLTKELEQKKSTLQAVQSVFEGMKEEQTNIRNTIEMLRVENAKLRGTPPPPPRSSKPKSSSSSLDSSDTSRRHKSSPSSPESSESSQYSILEARLRNIEKENNGLREALATLTTKLFDEMERTDELRVANEGLATRICKLVAFVQQNNGGRGVGAMLANTTPPGGSRRRGKSNSTC
jgi:chromosome segregation ATPase